MSIPTAVSSFFYRKPRIRLGLLLSGPMAWLGVAYLAALAALFVTAFWRADSFTGKVIIDWSMDNFRTLFTDKVYRAVTMRTIGIAVGVTVLDAIIAFPMALYMAKVASPRARRMLVIAVMTPLWASYLVKVYSWRVMLSGNGVMHWLLSPFGLDTPGYGLFATTLTLAYLWLPYMILPIYAGLERLPDSLLDASSDLGGRSWHTIRSVVAPMVLPSVVAGSIFTFSLTLGDYITVKIVGGPSQMLGNVVYDNIGAAGNLPFAATVACIPVALILVYLAAVRRTGALDNL
ncbi:ABC transporter permease [Nocardia sp. NBC_00565]|uniref:ABC transporter permease n=1 Tax=Nocardia sp. NBC_00565 TaxID=2975993 RepID=UPI002E8116B6|nr:ABC transporter permease [Nocardia sp. NBC_00565]WUC07561.1 ABC transporter permease [Nocardia sp. NBC_00565]